MTLFKLNVRFKYHSPPCLYIFGFYNSHIPTRSKVMVKTEYYLLNDVLCFIEGLVEDHNFFEDEYSVEDAELSVSVIHSSICVDFTS